MCMLCVVGYSACMGCMLLYNHDRLLSQHCCFHFPLHIVFVTHVQYTPLTTSVDIKLLEKQANDWKMDNRRLNVMFIGKHGSGKSSLATSVFDGAEIPVDNTVTSATLRDVSVNDVMVKLWEFSQPTQEIAQLLGAMDLVIYTLKMDDTRLRPDDMEMIQRLSKLGAPDLWEKSVIALTFANRVSSLDDRSREQRNKDGLRKKYNQWKEGIHKVLSEIELDDEVVHKIPFIPAGHRTQPRLFGESWMSNFVKCLLVGMRESDAVGGMWRALKDHVEVNGFTIKCAYFE